MNTKSFLSNTDLNEQRVLYIKPKTFTQDMSLDQVRTILNTSGVDTAIVDVDYVLIDYFHIHSVLFHFIQYCMENVGNGDMLNMEKFLINKRSDISQSYKHENETNDNGGEIKISDILLINSILRLFSVSIAGSGNKTLFNLSKDILVDLKPSSIYTYVSMYRNIFNFKKSFSENMTKNMNKENVGSVFSTVLKPLSLILINANSTNEVKVVNVVSYRNGSKHIRQTVKVPISIPFDMVREIRCKDVFFKSVKLIPIDFVRMFQEKNKRFYVTSLCNFGHDVGDMLVNAISTNVNAYSQVFINVFRRKNKESYVFYDEIFVEASNRKTRHSKHVIVANAHSTYGNSLGKANVLIKPFNIFDATHEVSIGDMLDGDNSLYLYKLSSKTNSYSMTSAVTIDSVQMSLLSLLMSLLGIFSYTKELKAFINSQKDALSKYVTILEKPLVNKRKYTAEGSQITLVRTLSKIAKKTKLMKQWTDFGSNRKMALSFMLSIYKILNHIQVSSIFFTNSSLRRHCYFAKAIILTMMYTEEKADEVSIYVGRNELPPIQNAYFTFLKHGIVVYGDNDLYKSMTNIVSKGAAIKPQIYGKLNKLVKEFESGKCSGVSHVHMEGTLKVKNSNLSKAMKKSFPSTIKDYNQEDGFKRLHLGVFIFNITLKLMRKSKFKYIQMVPKVLANQRREQLSNLLKYFKVSNFVSNLESDGYISIIYAAAKFSQWSSCLDIRDKETEEKVKHPKINTPVRLLELAWNVLNTPEYAIKNLKNREKDIPNSFIDIILNFYTLSSKTYMKDLFKHIYSILNDHSISIEAFETKHSVKFSRVLWFTVKKISKFYRDLAIAIYSNLNIYTAQVELSKDVYSKNLPMDLDVVIKYLNISTNFLLEKNDVDKFTLKSKFLPVLYTFNDEPIPMIDQTVVQEEVSLYVDAVGSKTPKSDIPIHSPEDEPLDNDFSLGDVGDEDVDFWSGDFDTNVEWGADPIDT